MKLIITIDDKLNLTPEQMAMVNHELAKISRPDYLATEPNERRITVAPYWTGWSNGDPVEQLKNPDTWAYSITDVYPTKSEIRKLTRDIIAGLPEPSDEYLAEAALADPRIVPYEEVRQDLRL